MGTGEAPAGQARHAQRVARLKRRLDAAEGRARAWDAGAVDEDSVAKRLSQLVPCGWYVLHNVNWPGRQDACLEHVLVGPGGVVVVEVKSWTGEVRVSSGLLWQDHYARPRAVERALAEGAAVASVLPPPHRSLVRSLICMARQPSLFGVTKCGVPVAGVDRIAAYIASLPVVLDQQGVIALYAEVGSQLTRHQEPGVVASWNTRAAMRVPQPRRAPVPAGTSASPGSGSASHRRQVRRQDAKRAAAIAFVTALVLVAACVMPYLSR